MPVLLVHSIVEPTEVEAGDVLERHFTDFGVFVEYLL